MRADFHTHSHFSFDGRQSATLDAMCESAIAHGLSYLAVTDHCDINGEIEGLYTPLDKEGVFAAVSTAKEKYKGRLQILFGLELGQPTQYPAEARALLARYPYDIVLGSLHNLAGERDFYYFDFTALSLTDIADYFDRAINEYMELVRFGGIHVLTHLTYMHRYLRRAGLDMDLTPFYPKLRALFAAMIQSGVALELNTSTLTSHGITMPTSALIALYRDCGGRLISLGSDAHCPEHIARDFDRGAAILLSCGFTELAVPTAGGILTLPLKEVHQ